MTVDAARHNQKSASVDLLLPAAKGHPQGRNPAALHTNICTCRFRSRNNCSATDYQVEIAHGFVPFQIQSVGDADASGERVGQREALSIQSRSASVVWKRLRMSGDFLTSFWVPLDQFSRAVGIVPEPPSSRGKNLVSHPVRGSHLPRRINANCSNCREHSGGPAVEQDSLLELAPP